ncbi:MAG: carbamoyltransferase HypF, partial [Desulfitobacteriaceae bacterium]|nr:carbamoyltransferase HypF [Desulfitobacteriaceae bacterium]
SVVRVNRGRVLLLRRSRGYAPEPIGLHLHLPEILACGGEQKNTFCLTKNDKAFLSQHIGDLENGQTLLNFEEGIEHYKTLFDIKPDIVAYDLHPEYLSTKYALTYPGEVKKIGVQHHHAHLASCLADNGEDGPAIGVCFDGTGYGPDGCIWGGEFLVGGYKNFIRAAYLAYVPMPSGSMAIKEPWRMTLSYLYAAYGSEMEFLNIDFIRCLPECWRLLREALDKKINSPLTSSCGRLFDGVAALIGLKNKITYEGQAAVELEQLITPGEDDFYPFEISSSGQWEIDWRPLIRGVVDDLKNGISQGVIAAKFHNTVAQMCMKTCLLIREFYGINKVALSGGVFQNVYLVNEAEDLLIRERFRVLTHRRVPPNDGGLSLGQALVASFQNAGKEHARCV